jgi:glyoxylase-like metal-dependent hydrolase (beta-lactamase superfamily II)
MVTRIGEGVFWVDLPGTNVYLVEDGDGVILVDAGLPWHRSRIATAIATVAGDIGAVDSVLVTHFDVDHVGCLNRLKGLDATVYASPHTASLLTKESKPSLSSHRGVMQRTLDVARSPLRLPLERVADGDTVGSFTAYHTPGHTPGHTAFVSETGSVAFLGDLVRETDGRLEPSGRLLSYDREAVRRSLTDLVTRAPDFEIACPGHGTPFSREGSARLAEAASDSQ